MKHEVTVELSILLFVNITITLVAIYFLGQWRKMVMLRNKGIDSVTQAVRVDAVCAFLAYFNLKVDTKKFSIFRVSSTQQLRQQELYKCRLIADKIPDYQLLISLNVPLVLNNFLTEEEIKFLTVVS